jgi:hypothetical protein
VRERERAIEKWNVQREGERAKEVEVEVQADPCHCNSIADHFVTGTSYTTTNSPGEMESPWVAP